MTEERWDPFREVLSLRESVERLFQESFVRFGGTLASAGLTYVPLDISESSDAYNVHASLPGARPEDVEVTVHGNVLTIRGESRAEEEQAGQSWVVRERRAGTVQRSIMLPTPVDPEGATARYEHGVLVLTLPKAARAPKRQIQVNAAADTDGVQDSRTAGAHSSPTQDSPASDADSSGDKVADQSDQSFPASDPPSWTPERA